MFVYAFQPRSTNISHVTRQKTQKLEAQSVAFVSTRIQTGSESFGFSSILIHKVGSRFHTTRHPLVFSSLNNPLFVLLISRMVAESGIVFFITSLRQRNTWIWWSWFMWGCYLIGRNYNMQEAGLCSNTWDDFIIL